MHCQWSSPAHMLSPVHIGGLTGVLLHLDSPGRTRTHSVLPDLLLFTWLLLPSPLWLQRLSHGCCCCLHGFKVYLLKTHAPALKFYHSIVKSITEKKEQKQHKNKRQWLNPMSLGTPPRGGAALLHSSSPFVRDHCLSCTWAALPCHTQTNRNQNQNRFPGSRGSDKLDQLPLTSNTADAMTLPSEEINRIQQGHVVSRRKKQNSNSVCGMMAQTTKIFESWGLES